MIEPRAFRGFSVHSSAGGWVRRRRICPLGEVSRLRGGGALLRQVHLQAKRRSLRRLPVALRAEGSVTLALLCRPADLIGGHLDDGLELGNVSLAGCRVGVCARMRVSARPCVSARQDALVRASSY
jgi:hypothetical protein